MKTGWENDGQANSEGDFVAFIDMENGKRPQRFMGKTEKEVADQLLTAQENATILIDRQRKALGGDKPEARQPAAPSRKRALSAGEKLKVVADMANPATVEEAITTVVESRIGRSLDSIAEEDKANAKAEEERAAVAAFRQFQSENEEYVNTDYNRKVLVKYMRNMNYPPTLHNFGLAFEELFSQGLMTKKPAAETQPDASQEPIPPVRTESSSSLRSSDAPSGGVPPARPRKKTWTKQELVEMPRAEYNKLYADPVSRAAIDAIA